jgi:hypothetical protein
MDDDGPLQFGWQPDRSYTPSPDEIERECIAIQRTWSRRERYKRQQGLPCERYHVSEWSVPLVHVVEIES